MKKMKLTSIQKNYIWILGSFLVIFITYVTFAGHFIAEDKEPIIAWQDEALGDAVKYNMWLSEDEEVPISWAEKFNSGRGYDSAGSPTMLLEGKDISRLDDLQYFTNQVNLTIKNTSVTDFSPLKKMKNLRKLSIDGGEAINLEPLQQLENLLELSLSDMSDTIIPSLEHLKQLTYLSLDGMSLENLSTIGTLRGVLYLSIKNTNIKNVSVLSDFMSLQALKIDNCPIETLPRLSESLEILELRRTAIEDLSVLPQQIRVIEIINNGIDSQPDGTFEENNGSGINIHAAGDNRASITGNPWSDGCQIVYWGDYVKFGKAVGFLNDNAPDIGKAKEINNLGTEYASSIKVTYVLDRSNLPDNQKNMFYPEE